MDSTHRRTVARSAGVLREVITTYQRFRRWSNAGVFDRIFEATGGDLDFRSVQVDGSFVKVHQHGTGAPKADARPTNPAATSNREKPRRLTTKLMAMTDGVGRLARFTLVPGNAAEVRELVPLLGDVRTGELIADKAYDSTAVRDELTSRGIVATIPTRRGMRPLPFDRESYQRRHLVENLFADLKQFRGLATRYCKLASRFRAMVSLAGWFLATRGGGGGRDELYLSAHTFGAPARVGDYRPK